MGREPFRPPRLILPLQSTWTSTTSAASGLLIAYGPDESRLWVVAVLHRGRNPLVMASV
jgi:hypothetical protein